jgi:hypothetical protein
LETGPTIMTTQALVAQPGRALTLIGRPKAAIYGQMLPLQSGCQFHIHQRRFKRSNTEKLGTIVSSVMLTAI